MMQFSITYEGVEGLLASLAQIEYRATTLRPLAEEFRGIMLDDALEAATAGVDANDVELAPLNWGRPLSARELRRRGGSGPPLMPKATSLRASGFTTEIVEGFDEVTVIGSWPTAPWMKFHVTGWTSPLGNFVPPRDPAGLRAQAQEAIATAFEAFVQSIVAG